MNTPKKIPLSSRWSINTNKRQLINDPLNKQLFEVFTNFLKKPENEWKDEFQILKEFIEFYNIENNWWLLTEISKTKEVEFDMIKNNWFSLEQVIWANKNVSSWILSKLLNHSNFGDLGNDIEIIIIETLVNKVRSTLPNDFKAKFDFEVTSPKTLNEFKNQIEWFFEFGWIDELLKNKIMWLKVTNLDIRDNLIKNKIIEKWDIDGWFISWDNNYKNSFDKMVTQQYLWWIGEFLNSIQNNFNNLKDTFTSFVPNLWWLLKEYPYDHKEVEKKFPEDAKWIEELQKKAENWDDIERINQEINKCRRDAHIKILREKNKDLANILRKLVNNNFNFGRIDKIDQKKLLNHITKDRLNYLKQNWIIEILDVDQKEFNNFVEDLFDFDKRRIKIPSSSWDIELQITKTIRWGENLDFWDINNFENAANIPIDIEIQIDENTANDILNNITLKEIFWWNLSEDRSSLKLTEKDIWKLLLLYVIWQKSFDKKDINQENAKILKKKFDEINEKQDNGNSTEKIWKNPENKKSPFEKIWNETKWYNFENDEWDIKWFKEWTRLWVKSWFDSELPPMDIGWDQWLQLKIIGTTNETFTIELSWWELSAWWLEGKKFTFLKDGKENENTLKNLNEKFNWEIYKLPDPNQSIDNSLASIKDSGIWLEFLETSFGWIKWKDGKFINEIKEWDPEITHFGSIEKTVDDWWVENSKSINYKVEYNKDKTITISYDNYKRKMDYNNFIIFVATKWLKPKTKEEADFEYTNYNEAAKWSNKKNWRLKFFSINSIKDVFSWMSKKISEKFKKELERQKDDLDDYMINGVKIYDIIWYLPFLWWTAEQLKKEARNERDRKIRKKIEVRVTFFEDDHDFGEAFKKPWYLPHSIWRSVSLKDIIISWKKPNWDNKYIVWASLLALIKKWPGPYSWWLEWYRFQWIWVKTLLWEKYQKKFLDDQKDLMDTIKNEKWKHWAWYDAQLANDLVRAEMNFLVNNIWWRALQQRFGNIKDDNTPKKERSDKFAWELDDRVNDYMSKNKIEEWEKKLDHIRNFTFAYTEYKRHIVGWKPTKALPFLQKMWELAKTKQQLDKFNMAVSYSILCWFFSDFTDPSVQTSIQIKCRTSWFLPWLWANNIDQKEKFFKFLSLIPWLSPLDYNPKIFSSENGDKIAYDKFVGKFEKRRINGNGEIITKFLKKDLHNSDIKNSIIDELKDFGLEEEENDINDKLSTNSKFITQFPMNHSQWIIKTISNYNNWIFNGKDNDEKSRAKDLRSAIARDIPKWKISRSEFKFVSKKFLNWFNEKWFDYKGKEEFLRKIATIKKLNNKTWKRYITDSRWEEKYIWTVKKSDIDDIMRYAVNWEIFRNGWKTPPEEFKRAIDAFKDMFLNNIDQIDEEFVDDVFGKDYIKFLDKNQAYELAPWEHYNKLKTRWSSDTKDEIEKQILSDYNNESGVYINKSIDSMGSRLRERWVTPPRWNVIEFSRRNIIYWEVA